MGRLLRVLIWIVGTLQLVVALMLLRLHWFSQNDIPSLLLLLLQPETSVRSASRGNDYRGAPNSDSSVVSSTAGDCTHPLTNATMGGINRYTPVPRVSQKTYYVMKTQNNAAIAQLLSANPSYRQVEVAKEASIVWTKNMVDVEPMLRLVLGKGALSFKDVQPWQRINHLRSEKQLDDKERLLDGIRQYYAERHRSFSSTMGTVPHPWFMPESYRLHIEEERTELARRLDPLTGGGIDEAWVWKDPAAERGEGVVMLGPGSDQLKDLQTKLVSGTVPSLLRHNSTEKRAKRTIVQKYVPSIRWEGRHKFDLRIYWLVVSINPLLVYYHDGHVRVSLTEYDPNDFSEQNLKSHLTNVAQTLASRGDSNEKVDEHDVLDLAIRSFDDLDGILREHMASQPHESSHFDARMLADPLSHIRERMKDVLQTTVAAFRETVFSPEGCPADNCYALYGADFMIDEDLNVWLTEVNDIPDMSTTAKAKRKVFDVFAPQIFNMIDEVRDKQLSNGTATSQILPLMSAITWELSYC